MDEAKLKTIVGGSVDDATSVLAGLSIDELNKLHDLETAGKKRSTMFAAIDAGRNGRSSSGTGETGAGADLAGDTGAVSGAVTYSQQQVDDMLAEQRDTQAAMFTREQLDEALATQKFSLDAERDRAVADAKGAAAEPVKVDQVRPLSIGFRAGHPSLVALSEVTSVLFVDQHNVPIAGLPAMTFNPSDFEPAGDAVTLKTEVEFPKEIPATEVSGAFLLDDEDDPVGKATLVMPFAVGGGKTAKFGKSTLQFAG